MAAFVSVTHRDGVAHLRLNRPERLNAVDFEGGRHYRDAVQTAVSDDAVRAIVLSGEGSSFCAGGDVLAMASAGATGSEVTAAAHVIHEGIRTLVESTVPVVAAVQGAVAGGGIGLMLAADYIVASPTLRVAGKYADIGLTPDLGATTLLPRAIGERRALEVLVGGRELDADTSLAWGLVAEVDDEPLKRATAIAVQWAQGASAAYGRAKRLVRTAPDTTFGDALDAEADCIGQAYESPDAQARIHAFARAHRDKS